MNDKIKSIGSSIGMLCVFFAIATFVRNMIIKLGKQKIDEPQNKDIDHVSIMYSQLAFFAFYFIIFIGLAFILPTFGIQKETMIALLGTVAFAIGISAQGALSNIWYGLIIMMNNVYNVGDVITVNVANIDSVFTGRITSMNLFYTRLADLESGNELIISNNNIYNNSVSTNKSIVYTIK